MTKLKRDLLRHPMRLNLADDDHRRLIALARSTELPMTWHVRKALHQYLREAEEVET